jgi:hypothetical protein
MINPHTAMVMLSPPVVAKPDDVVRASAALTVSVRVWVAMLLLASVAVTVKVLTPAGSSGSR